MEPQDDPEQRIRQLEQHVSPTEPYSSGDYTPMPPMPPPPPYGAPPYGTPYPMTGRPASAGFRWVWYLIAGIVFAVVAVTVGIVISTVNSATHGISITTAVPSPGATLGRPSVGVGTPGGSVTVLPPGGSLTISGMGQNKTVVCNDGTVSVSGMSNTITIKGHCVKLAVSGMQNKIDIDTADTIGASGFKNQIIYHSGSPKVDAAGGGNVVQQG